MKKIRILFAASAVLAALSALAFVNNLVAIARWWRALLAAGGDTTGIPAHAPGCFAWLDWTAVDYSAVTTFIPLLGFVCLALSAWKVLKGRVIDHADDFPFFRGSDQLNVALGLFGTLWGIIVIGYFKLDTVTMADLMQCLHTALFSTLMAVVWVFLIDRPLIRPYFQRLLAESGLARVEEGDLAGAVDRLVERLGAASDAFDARQRQYEAAFEKRQAAEAEAAAQRQARADALFEKHIAEQSEAFSKHLSDAIGKLAEAQAQANEALVKRQAEADAALAKRTAAEDEAVAHALAELERVRKETTEQCARQLAEYQQAFEARQKEYVEFFKREIESLEKRAKDSENRLKAVTAALQS